MTKYIFRGKCIADSREFNGKWVYGDLIHSDGKTYIHPQSNAVSVENGLGRIIVMHEVDRKTVKLELNNENFVKLGDRVDVIHVDMECGANDVVYIDGVFVAEDDLYYYIEKDDSYKMFPFNKHCYILRKPGEV